MQSLTYVVGKDKRNLVDDIQNFKIDFKDSNYNWVQARQYEDGMRQVFVTMKNEDGSPFDLTGCNYWFEGILPDGVHKILDAKHGVAIDPVNGQFRFDMPKQAFAVAGSYVQAFFRIMRDGASITTLEFDLQVLADKVITGLIPSDYITPFEDLYTQLLGIIDKSGQDAAAAIANLQAKVADTLKVLQDQSDINYEKLATLAGAVGAVQAQIDAGNVVTRAQLAQFENQTNSKLQTYFENLGNGTPQFVDSLAALKTKYPTGTAGIFVANDDGHRYAYYNDGWQDGGVYQGTGIAKKAMQQVSTYIRDQQSLIKNGDFNAGTTDPFQLLSKNATLSILYFNQKNWLHVIGTEDTTPYKGVRYRLALDDPEIANYGYDYWTTKLKFVIQNAATKTHDFSIQYNLLDKNQNLLSTTDMEDFSLTPLTDFNVATYLPPLSKFFKASSETEYIDICIMDNQADGVSFFISAVSLAKDNLDAINHDKDAYFDYDNFIQNGNFAKQTYVPFQANTTAQTMITTNFNHKTWLHIAGIDNTTANKGVFYTWAVNRYPDKNFGPIYWPMEFGFLINSHAAGYHTYLITAILKDANGNKLVTKQLDSFTMTGLVDRIVNIFVPKLADLYVNASQVATVDFIVADSQPDSVDFHVTDFKLKKHDDVVLDAEQGAIFDYQNLIKNGNFIQNTVLPFQPNNNVTLSLLDFNGRSWLHVTGNDSTTGYAGTYVPFMNFTDVKFANRGAQTWNLEASFDFMNNQPSGSGRFEIREICYDKDGNVIGNVTVDSFDALRQRDVSVKTIIPTINTTLDKATADAVTEMRLVVYAVNPADVDFFITNVRIHRAKKFALNELNQALVKQATGLPTVELNGEIGQITHGNAAIISVRLNLPAKSVLAYAKIKWQGNSSLKWVKKNYKLKLYRDAAATTKLPVQLRSDWPTDSEYVLKANYIDATQARNLVNAQLAKEVAYSRENLPTEQLGNPALSQIQGFPVTVLNNGTSLGLFTLNTSKDDTLFNMDATNPNHIAVEANNITPASNFQASAAAIDDTDFSLDFPATINTDIHEKFNALLKFVNEASDEDFKAQLGDHINLATLRDHVIFNNTIDNADAWVKNVILTTYNGKQWNVLSYDLDSSWGLKWDGTELRDVNANYWNNAARINNNKLLNRYVQLFAADIKPRYTELRQTVLSAPHIVNCYRQYMGRISPSDYAADQVIWPNQPSKNLTDFKQLQAFIVRRLQVVDDQVANLK
ncbi:CotH kinase family protein [Lactiplantibacillus pentosus]